MRVIDAHSSGMFPANQGHRIGKLPYRKVAGRRIIVWTSEVAQLRRFKTDIYGNPAALTWQRSKDTSQSEAGDFAARRGRHTLN
jgi:hypothetical protein